MWCLDFADDTLVSGSYDKTINVWSLKHGNVKCTLRGHTSALVRLVWCCDALTRFNCRRLGQLGVAERRYDCQRLVGFNCQGDPHLLWLLKL